MTTDKIQNRNARLVVIKPNVEEKSVYIDVDDIEYDEVIHDGL